MKKRRAGKLIAAIVMIAAAAVIFYLLFIRTGKLYRSIRVLDYEGQVDMTRGERALSVYKNMLIRGGDRMATGEDSRADLRLDDDKYLVVEPSTRLSFELSGNKHEGAIRIRLDEGAVYNSIENPLEDGDSYEVVTPDGVMAVRGTRFRVAVENNAEGSARQTRVSVWEGAVYVELNNSEKDSISLQAGNEALIESGSDGGESFFLIGEQDIDEDAVPDYLKEELAAAGSTEEESYEITVEEDGSSYILMQDHAAAGSTVTLSAPQSDGREIDHWELFLDGDEGEATKKQGQSVSFTMPSHDVRVRIVFAE